MKNNGQLQGHVIDYEKKLAWTRLLQLYEP